MFQWFPVYLQVLMIICVSIVLNTCMLLSPWLTTDFHILVIIFVCHVPIISLVTLTSWLCACFCISLIKCVPLVLVAVDVFPQSHLFLVYPSITSILLWFAFEFRQICQYLFSMNNDKSITKGLKKNCQYLYFIVKWWEFDGNSLHAIYSIPVFLLPPCCILYLRCRLFRSYVRLIILYQAWSAPFETFMFSGIEHRIGENQDSHHFKQYSKSDWLIQLFVNCYLKNMIWSKRSKADRFWSILII